MKILGTECRLSQMLDKVCQSVAAVDPKTDGLAMFEKVAAARPNLRAQFEVALKAKPGNQGLVQLLIGASAVMAVKEAPDLIAGLVHRIDQPAPQLAQITMRQFEGNDVAIPGGPSLVGGQLYVPS